MNNILKSSQTYQETFDRFKSANKENKETAIQLVNSFSEQNMTSYNAEIILNLCHDLIEMSSQIKPTI